MSGLTAAELARQAGTTPEGIERLVGLGILERGEGQRPFADRDIHRVRFAEAIRAAGISLVGFFREHVMGPMLARGVPRQEMLDAVGPLAVQMRASSTELRNWLYDRHLEALTFQTAIEEVEAVLAEAGFPQRRPLRCPAIAFLDLGGYTRMTQETGDRAAVELATTLVELVRRAAADFRGEVVKLLGDGVMFHFDDPAGAVACALHLVGAAEGRGLPPARAGIHAGAVVTRDGDYFGSTVNLAARIADYARPREVLVSADVTEVAPDAAAYEPIGDIGLRGLAEPVALFRALIRDSSPAG
ncbi:MAG TPA: adenylate/guanylate cyclase domain-containing protein [Gaiellaceae bacterium]|nr:adenylate/guanylate cyclase domain-containing protein [Gaiellaceae bacterium]